MSTATKEQYTPHSDRPADKPPTRGERIKALVEGYAHGLQSNAPRHAAELKELRELLGEGDDKAKA